MAYFAGDPYDVAPVAHAVEAEGRRALTLECDVASRGAVDGAVERVVAELGSIDIVIANAGIARLVPSVELDDERFGAAARRRPDGRLPLLPRRACRT